MRRKLFIILSITALAAASCVKEIRKGTDDVESIGFVASLDVSDDIISRGTMTNTTANLAALGGFKVWAIEHAGTWAATPIGGKSYVMNGLSVTSSDGGATWSYGADIMWPGGNNVSFFAYAPIASATITTDSDATPVATFAVVGDDDDQTYGIVDQTDLLIAAPVLDLSGTSYVRPVDIRLKHALSRISFSGLMSDVTDERAIRIKSITLNGLYNSGSARFADPVVWTYTGDPDASYTVTTGTNGGIVNANLGGSSLGTPVQLTTSTGYLFLMPQQLARSLGEDPTMDVTLEIDGTEYSYTSLVFSPNAWEPGRSYNYQIVIGKDDLRVIYIDSNIGLEDWTPSLVLQTVPLTSDRDKDRVKLLYSMSVLNEVRTMSRRYSWFGLYGVNDINHDMVMDVEDLVTSGYADNFTEGQNLMIDLKKLVRNWGVNTEEGNRPWKVSVINYDRATGANADYWTLEPAAQQVDAYSGATLRFPGDPLYNSSLPSPSNEITSRGSIIIKRTNVPY